MISNKIADAVIAQARHELAIDNRRPAQVQRGAPLGDYVQLVFCAVTGDAHRIPFAHELDSRGRALLAELDKCSSAARCREIILEIAQ